MSIEDDSNHKDKKFIIGEVIHEKFLDSGLSLPEFGHLIACEVRNVHRIFKREHMDTDLLERISQALHFNFFDIYGQHLNWNETNRIQVKIEMDIPVGDWKTIKLCEWCKWIQENKAKIQGSHPCMK